MAEISTKELMKYVMWGAIAIFALILIILLISIINVPINMINDAVPKGSLLPN